MFKYLKIAFYFIIISLFFSLLLPWSDFLGTKMDIMNSLALPSFKHPLGTDSMGRDLLVRFHQSLYNSILPIWIFCTLVSIGSVVLSVLLFSINSNFINRVFSFSKTLIVSVPITIACLFLSVYYEEISFEILLIAIGLLILSKNYQLIEHNFHRCSKFGFWISHEMMGGSKLDRIVRYGLLKSWKLPLIELFFINLQLAFIIEISLSYLGFGVQEPKPSFGNMFKSHFDLILRGDFYTVSVIILFMCITLILPKLLSNIITSTFCTFQIDQKGTD